MVHQKRGDLNGRGSLKHGEGSMGQDLQHSDSVDSEVSADQSQNVSRRHRLTTWLRECAIVLVIAFALSTLLRLFVVQVFWIPSPSMNNTLLEDDRIAVSRLSAWTGSIERGDVVVFNDALEWLPPIESDGLAGYVRQAGEFIGVLPANGEQALVKRVIGVGGDHVYCCTADGSLTVNGVSIEEPYVANGQSPSTVPFDVTVPDGKLWVMGDNRRNSADSRFHMRDGESPFVSIDDVVGRAWSVIWPISRWSSVGHREVFDDVPDPHE